MSGPKRNPDKLNTIGVVVVGICGAVLVYVTIVALQAFYMSNTSQLQTMKDYGGQDLTAKGRKADEMRNITEPAKNSVGEGQQPTFRIPVSIAMTLVAEDAKKDPSHLIPALPPSTKPSIEPVFGRPKPAVAPAPAGGETPAAPAGGAAPAPEAGSAAPAGTQAAPTAPTGALGPGGSQPTGTQPKADPKAPAPKADAKAPAPKADAKAPAPAPAPAQPKKP
jgi:hypothetical protein